MKTIAHSHAAHAGASVAPWPLPAEVAVVEVNGYPLAYRDIGSGPPLVLIHGSFNDFRAWGLQWQDLSAAHRVLAPSLRHYYPEPWDGQTSDFTITQHADDLAAFLRALSIESPAVLGHSRGGAVALSLATRYPELVGRLILADPRGLEALLPASPESMKLANELREIFDELKRNLHRGNIEHAARTFVDTLAGPGAWERRPPELRQMFFDNIATAVDTADAPMLSCSDIARLPMPVLLLTGARSPRRYREMFAALRACDPRMPEPVEIPDAGHAMHRDNPEAFNGAVLTWVRTRTPPPKADPTLG